MRVFVREWGDDAVRLPASVSAAAGIAVDGNDFTVGFVFANVNVNGGCGESFSV